MPKFLIFIHLFAVFVGLQVKAEAAAETSKAIYQNLPLKFQHYHSGIPMVNIEMTSLSSSHDKIKIVYKKTPARKAEKSFIKSQNFNGATFRALIDPLFQKENDLASWKTDKNCLGKEVWLFKIDNQPEKSICSQPEKIKKLKKFFLTVRLMMTKP